MIGGGFVTLPTFLLGKGLRDGIRGSELTGRRKPRWHS